MQGKAFIAAAIFLACFASAHAAPKLDCQLTFFVNQQYGGDSKAVSMTIFPANGTSKYVVADVGKTLGKLASNPSKTWDDNMASFKYRCNCTEDVGYTCSSMFAKVNLRLFADPQRRKTQGGPLLDYTCPALAAAAGSTAPAACGNGTAVMPTKWSDRTSAFALTYNIADYKLPKKANAPARRMMA